MKPTREVLAKAEQLNGKVVVVTLGTSALGEVICRQAAILGATVFALDVDATALAQQAISFRQNSLRLRGIPCDLSSQISIKRAIEEITSHAPPVDLWIHAESMGKAQLENLNLACTVFGQHFNQRGKGNVGLVLTSTAFLESQNGSIATSLQGQASSSVVTLNLITKEAKKLANAAAELLDSYRQSLRDRE